LGETACLRIGHDGNCDGFGRGLVETRTKFELFRTRFILRWKLYQEGARSRRATPASQTIGIALRRKLKGGMSTHGEVDTAPVFPKLGKLNSS
jgi:hypothetical protein